MTIPDPNLERRPGADEESLRDIIPPTERSQDPAITEAMHGLSGDVARPLTDDEKKAADRDTPVGERVYAPASERVPVEPVPGHREFIDHTDTHTRERQAAGQTVSGPDEASSTRVTPPSVTPSGGSTGSQAYDDSAWNSGARSGGLPFGLPFGLAWIALGVAAGIGGWLLVRWQRERNKPINRIRRQAKQAAGEIRDRVPTSPEEAVKPAAGLTTALLSILLLLWQQAQARSRQPDSVVARQGKKAGKRADKAVARAAEAVSEIDWRQRLTALKKHWNPSRMELEKISISRH
ncbi:MAG: hypothetical protein M3069_24950 [Chloroflexota bacterium]|nr:hypothetical protein [Chloroflexota bacterium]